MTVDDLRRNAVAHSLFPRTSLPDALERLQFTQADPIRAPARAQDLILHQRVESYRAGDLERSYPTLPIDEDIFINYGFVTRTLSKLMHPRTVAGRVSARRKQRFEAVLAFVRDLGEVHPREVDARFGHGSETNYWGGSSKATTRMLEQMHYRGLLRVHRREQGIRMYAAVLESSPARIPRSIATSVDALVDIVVRLYAPVPAPSLSLLVRRLRYAAPQWRTKLTSALQRARLRLPRMRVDGLEWFWADQPPSEPSGRDERVRLLAPFDPVVWDRRRFELLWGWAYRFEAYTPAPKRKLGYYALPLLWRDQVIGWGNMAVVSNQLQSSFGYVEREPRERVFRRELEAEVERMRHFLIPTVNRR